MKVRANSNLAKLTPDQLDQVFDWICSGVTYRDVQERCSQHSPQGFGIRINISTLCGFYQRERASRHAEQLAEARFHQLDTADPEQLMQNVRVELAHACFDLASNVPSSSTVNSLSRATNRLALLKLAQQRVTLEEQRLALERDGLDEKKRQFNFNAACQAAKHANKINEIIKAKGPDLEEKMWQISDTVFGPIPPLPVEAGSSPITDHQSSIINKSHEPQRPLLRSTARPSRRPVHQFSLSHRMVYRLETSVTCVRGDR